MASKAKTVLLLKAKDSEITPDPENPPDPYIEKLKECGISASIIPTLEFTFINDGILQHFLSRPDDFDGLMFTSPRTVRAVHRVCFFQDIDISKWAEKKNFAVGEATSKIAGVDNFPKPLLLPCGQKNRAAITTFLTENDFQVTSVMCYRTECNPKMKECFENLIISQGIPNIIVFFSPSGVKLTCEIIKAFSETPQCIAVGPTTEQAILEANLNLCKVSENQIQVVYLKL
ncbi:uroporphyrinogen-III synthase [Caerostris extrusa]|uniref:Uroporphyrinogen-III synthase n=1 Tax=Caerostris extrusa TaxID=172846 RepID=A0AAV4P1F2_CAEEX|nr:uroporphyrinogen-III synthase [Caerostris extrusa]